MAPKVDVSSAAKGDVMSLADALMLADRHRSTGRLVEAQAQCRRILDVWPSEPNAVHLLGLIAHQSGRLDDAVGYLRRTIELAPDVALYRANLGEMCRLAGQASEAVKHGRHALRLRPNYPEALTYLGLALYDLEEYEEAAACHRRGIALAPTLAVAHYNLGTALMQLGRYDEAAASFGNLYNLDPTFAYALGNLVHCQQQICSWNGLDALIVELKNGVREGKPVVSPFSLLSVTSSSADQLQCAKRYVADHLPLFAELCRGETYSHDRIRIAYLSSDFRPHSVGVLAVGLFEKHDKARFDTTAVSFGPDEESGIHQRIRNSFEHFIDVRSKSDQEIAELIRTLEIDIAVDLNGHISGGRPNILSRRPAPIQVSYLGYPGTTGARHIDYILADPTVIPEDQFDCYSERVVWLPDSFLVNDRRLRISERTPTRAECGLPEAAFVFSCFNNAYKITPEIFDIWMRLLRAVDGSVFWLVENSTASINLRGEANKRGVASERLIFSPKVPLGDHLARQRQADLFLDTLPYNGGTMAAMALWAGLPVLTCLGSTFVGRMAASALKAVALPELITTSLEDYEQLALTLARDPSILASLKAKLAHNRKIYPLFDTERSTRHIERAYTTMWERRQRGEPPRSFAVDPSP